MPILTYGFEIFGFENLDLLEKIHTDFLKKITKCRRSTPSYILYAELGRFRINIIIKSSIIGYWNKIILGKHTKISYTCILYQVLKTPENVTSKWILNVKRILCDIGRHELGPVKRICVFAHSVMTNFNCACPAIQRGQGSGFLSECSS